MHAAHRALPAFLAVFLVVTPAAAANDSVEPMIGPSGTPMGTVVESGEAVLASPDGVDLPLGGSNEPTVAAYGNIVAAASLFRLRISTDGGATFGLFVSPPLPPGYYRNGDSSLGFDSQGRLFWTYLGGRNDEVGWDLFIAQVDPLTRAILPGYPVNITDSPGVALPGSTGLFHDKEWLAVDATASSPYADRLYVTWTEFGPDIRVLVTWSDDQGLTWNPAVQLSESSEGFPWPAHAAVAPNGDVFVGYHAQPGYPDGVSGKIYIARSTDGGVSYPQKTLAYLPGEADMTFNVQDAPGAIPGAQFWLQGSVQPWILPDPLTPGRIFVVANDDPDNDPTSGDAADVFINVSTDDGLTWGTPMRIDSGPDGTFQVMPTAAIDPQTGTIAVHYFDNRADSLNSAGRYLLDVYMTSTTDATPTFEPDWQINDQPFNPDPGAPERFPGPPPTTRIGEYNGVAVGLGVAYSVWCGNTYGGPGGIPSGQQTWFDAVSLPPRTTVAGFIPVRGSALDLRAGYPNPLGPQTTLSYSLPSSGNARLTIHDVRGRLVAVLVDRVQSRGDHVASWDGLDASGTRVGEGVYFARLESAGENRTRKIILAR